MASHTAQTSEARDGLSTALRLLTVFPAASRGVAPDSGRRAVKWFPLVGAVVGGTVGAVCVLVLSILRWLGVDALTAAMLTGVVGTIADFALTRGMHWDGLADVADAWWGGFDTDRRLEIMSDSAVGTFGVFAVLATFGLLVIGLVMLAQHFWILIPAFAIARLAAVFAAQLGKPAKVEGLGSSVLAHGTAFAHGRTAVMTWFVAVITCFIAVGPLWVLHALPHSLAVVGATVVSVLAAAAIPHLIALRMGGVTGDVIGASTLLAQVVSVLAFAIAIH